MTNHRIAELKEQINTCIAHSHKASATYRDIRDLRDLHVPENRLADLTAKATYHDEQAAPYAELVAELKQLQEEQK